MDILMIFANKLSQSSGLTQPKLKLKWGLVSFFPANPTTQQPRKVFFSTASNLGSVRKSLLPKSHLLASLGRSQLGTDQAQLVISYQPTIQTKSAGGKDIRNRWSEATGSQKLDYVARYSIVQLDINDIVDYCLQAALSTLLHSVQHILLELIVGTDNTISLTMYLQYM